MTTEMIIKQDLKCVFNMPQQLRSEFDGGGEYAHSLPPYAPVGVYPVDEYDSCPTNWMHGSDIVSSYFLGVKEDHGMWMDFNECFYHTHEVAIVLSIQGVNPLTGQKMVKDKALCLEQYHKKCPIHKVNFKQDRYCEKCGYKWPGQNYIATTGTPESRLWIDGFRTPEGKVRQYIFTEDKMRGVAAQLIGEDRVFAIGIAYYLSKKKKPYTLKRSERIDSSSNDFLGAVKSIGIEPSDYAPPAYMGYPDPEIWNNGNHTGSPVGNLDYTENCDLNIKSFVGDGIEMSSNLGAISSNSAGSNNTKKVATGGVLTNSVSMFRSAGEFVVPVKKLEIGAGAIIEQAIYDDPKEISYWEDKPAGMIYINYCDAETLKKILDGGRRADKKDGFMKDIKVGG
jgi:hypothetical protein